MIKSPRNPNKQPASPKLVAVIKNGMTEQEMKESGEDWATHTGPYMTLKDVLTLEADRQKQKSA